jgi:hypothetical protein
MSVFTNLIGKRINGIFVNGEQDQVVFRTTEGRYLGFATCGDCCNTVFINHFSGADVVGEGNSFDLLRGALVTKTEDKGWSENETKVEGWSVTQDGFFTITTDRGYIDLEVRNEHNGYYGGHVTELDQEDIDLSELKQLLEDF